MKRFKSNVLNYLNSDEAKNMSPEQSGHFLMIASAIMKNLIKKLFHKDLVEIYFKSPQFQKDRLKENVFWISGPPGTGKSFLINHIINFVEINRYGSISNIAWQGVTAMLMRNGGRTISSIFSVPRKEEK